MFDWIEVWKSENIRLWYNVLSYNTAVKRAHKARTYWYCRPFCLIYGYQIKDLYIYLFILIKKGNGQKH